MAPSSSRDRISVDLRGMKAALLAQARASGATPSDVIRAALAGVLCGEPHVGQQAAPSLTARGPGPRVRLTLRVRPQEAQLVLDRARAAGLPAGAFVAGLCAGVPAVADGARPADQVAALIASSAELATLARDLRHLTLLLREGHVQAARVYRERLEDVEGDVRAHLARAAALTRELMPLRVAVTTKRDPSRSRR